MQRAGAGLGLSAVFAVGLVGGLVLHLDLPLTREVVATQTRAALDGLFVGDVTLGPISKLSADGLSIDAFAVGDGDGEVLALEGVTLRGDWVSPVLDFALGPDPVLKLPPIRAERVRVDLRSTDGELAIGRVFQSQNPSPPREGPRAPFLLRLSRVEIGHADVVGTLGEDGPTLDAEVEELAGTFGVGDDGLSLRVEPTRVLESSLLGVPLDALVTFQLERRSERDATPATLALGGTIDGRVGALSVEAAARLQDGELRAMVAVPQLGPSDLKPWVPRPLPLEPTAVKLWAAGELPRLAVQAEITALDGGATVSLRGAGQIDPADLRAGVTLRADTIDLQRLDPSWPHTELGLETEVSTRIDGEDSEVLATLRTPPGTISGQSIPGLEGRIGAARVGVFTRLVVHEPGLDAEIGGELRSPEDADVALRVHADAIPRVRRLAGLGLPLIRGEVNLQSEARLRGEALDVGIRANGRRLAVPEQKVAVEQVRLDGRLRGTTAAPEKMRLRASGRGVGAEVPDLRLETFSLQAVGPLLAPAVKVEAEDQLTREVRLAAQLDALRKRATDIKVSLQRGDQRLTGRVEEVGLRDREVVVEGIDLSGLGGGVEGGLRVRDGELLGRLKARKVDLAAMGQLLGRALPMAGAASLDIDLRPDDGGRKGYASVFIDDLEAGGVEGIQVEVRAAFEKNTITPYAVVRLRREDDELCGGDVAALVVTGRAELPGKLLSPESWKTLDGEGAVQLQRAKLACLVPLVKERVTKAKDAPPWPLGEVEGTVDATAQWRVKKGAGSIPAFGVQTQGLIVAAAPPPAEEGAPEPLPAWRSDRLDLAIGGAFDATRPAAAEAELRVSLIERRGDGVILPVVKAEVSSTLDLPALSDARRRKAVLDGTPLHGSVTVPRRNIVRLVEVLPTPMRDDAPQPMGDIEGQLFVAGTFGDPNVGVRLSSTGLGPRRRAVDARSRGRSDVDVIGSYSKKRGRIDLGFRFADEEVLTITGELNGALVPEEGDPRRTGTIQARLQGFPLGGLPVLAARGVAGRLSGDFRFDGLGRSPRLSMTLSSPELVLGPNTLENVRISVTPDANEAGMMTLSGELPVRGGGRLKLRGFGGLAWREETFPTPDRKRPAQIEFEARDFPLDVLEPFLLSDAIGGISGTLDGDFSLAAMDLDSAPSIQANVTLLNGKVQLPGQEITEIQARLVSKGSLLSLEDFEAELYPGRVKGHLDVALRGLDPVLLRGELAVADDAPVPLILDGVPLGRTSGTFDIGGRREEKQFTLEIASDDLVVNLPGSAQRNVQSLDEHPDVNVSHALGPPQRRRDEEDDGRAIAVSVALRNAVIMSGNTLDVRLSTTRPLRAGTGAVTGEIELTDGSLGLLGKRFSIDRGTVRLDEENPGNPDVNVTAHWDAPDGTTVFIDYIGRLRPLTQDKIRFRSSPPRSQQALITLILLGNPDEGVNDVAEEGGNERATNLGQGVAAMQINQLLGEAVPGLSTSLSTTEDDRLATTVKYRLTDSFTAAATVETNTGTTESTQDAGINGTKLSVDYRFLRYFIVRGSVGIGNGIAQGLDLLFQYRF